MLYIGIDWAEKTHHVCIRDDGKIHAEIEVPNSAEGAADLLKKMAATEPDRRIVFFAIEANHGPFIDAILDAGYTIYPLNPKAVERYRDRFHLARAKTDWIDARVLADILRTDRQAYPPLKPDSEETTMLRLAHPRLRRAREDPNHAQEPAPLRPAVLLPPGHRTVPRPGQPHGPGILKAYPTHQEARRATPEALEALLRAHRYPRTRKKGKGTLPGPAKAPIRRPAGHGRSQTTAGRPPGGPTGDPQRSDRQVQERDRRPDARAS